MRVKWGELEYQTQVSSLYSRCIPHLYTIHIYTVYSKRYILMIATEYKKGNIAQNNYEILLRMALFHCLIRVEG